MNRPTKPPADLYEQDFFLWSQEQARALREAAHAGTNLPLDWENLAEEIESLGRSDRRELRSRIRTILEHLLKQACSPADTPRAGWNETVLRSRTEAEVVLNDSPSLRRESRAMVAEELPKAIALVCRSLRDHREWNPEVEAKLARASFTADQVLGDWWPPDTSE
jgi:hypothetical protein